MTERKTDRRTIYTKNIIKDSMIFRSGMDTLTRYGLNPSVPPYTTFPDSSNAECPGFLSAHG